MKIARAKARARASRTGAPHAPVRMGRGSAGKRPSGVAPSAGPDGAAEPAPLSLDIDGEGGGGHEYRRRSVPRPAAARRRRCWLPRMEWRRPRCGRCSASATGEPRSGRAARRGERATPSDRRRRPLGRRLIDVRGRTVCRDARREASEGRLGRTSARVLSRLGAGKGSQAISARATGKRARRALASSPIYAGAKRRRGPRTHQHRVARARARRCIGRSSDGREVGLPGQVCAR